MPGSAIRAPGVSLAEGLDVDGGPSPMGSGHDPAMRTSGNQVNVVSRRFNSYPCRPPQRVWAGEVVSFFPHPQALLGDAVVQVAGALKALPSPRGGLAMPLPVSGSKSELYFWSKRSLDPTLRTTLSQEYMEQVQLIIVDRTAQVPRVSATFRMAGPLRWRRCGPPRWRLRRGISLLVVMRSKAGGHILKPLGDRTGTPA